MQYKFINSKLMFMVFVFTSAAGINTITPAYSYTDAKVLKFSKQAADDLIADKISAAMSRKKAYEKKSSVDKLGEFVRTVGPEQGCHFSSIQAAINGSLSGDSVKVVGSVVWDEHLVIQDKSINLIGGYNTCADALNNPDSNLFKVTTLDYGNDGIDPQPGIRVLSAFPEVVTIENFAIKNVLRDVNTVGGGMLVAGNLELYMRNMEIENNVAYEGGGIEINGSLGPLVVMTDSLIKNNWAMIGGGVHASGGAGVIIFNGDSALVNNRAKHNGAGAFVSQGSLLAFASGHSGSYVGNKTAAQTYESGVYGNWAQNWDDASEVTRGGAFYVVNGGLLALIGDKYNNVINVNGVVNVWDNHAAQGAAIYVSGSNSVVYAQGVLGHENLASVAVPNSSKGGFAYVGDQATFTMFGRLDAPDAVCWDNSQCSLLVDNKSLSDLKIGGALYAESAAQLTVSGVRFERNVANSGQAIYLDGLNTYLHLENSEIVQHGTNENFPGFSTVHLINGATMNSLHNSIINNDSTTSIILANMGNNPNTGFSDLSSIIYNQAQYPVDVYSGDALGVLFDCLITHDDAINGNVQRASIFNDAMLGMKDLANGDYDLTDQSLVIDYCDDSNIGALLSITDIKGVPRGNDGPAIGVFGFYDVGANAYQSSIAGISVINDGGLYTSESGDADVLEFFLDTQPNNTVTLNITVDNDEASVSPTQLIFTPFDYSFPKPVVVTGEDDDEYDGHQNYIVTAEISTSDNQYTALDDPQIGGLNYDNDAQVLITPSDGLVTTEGGITDSFSVSVTLPPASGLPNNVTVKFSGVDQTEGMLDKNQVVFTSNNWQDAQTVTIVPKDDPEVDGDQVYAIITTVESGDPKYAGLSVTDVNVTNLDDDNAVVIEPNVFLETTEAGGQAQFDVYLQVQPTEMVYVHLKSLDESEGVLDTEVLEFTSLTWGDAQTVTVTGVNDDLDDGDIMYSIETTVVTDDPFFNGYNPEDVHLTNRDDDEANNNPGIAISPASGLETTEFGNGLAIYSVVLTSQPSATVTVSSASMDSSEGLVTNGGNLQFTINDWNIPKMVTVTGQDDDIDDGDVAYAVQVNVDSSDFQYNNMVVLPVQLTNIDDDEVTLPGLGAMVFSKTAGIETSEAGEVDVILVSLASSPGENVHVTVDFTIANDFQTEVSLPENQLVFDSSNWSIPVELVIAGVDDNFVDGDVLFNITAQSSTDVQLSPYNGLNEFIYGTNLDNDKGVLVSPSPDVFLQTKENGTPAQFTLVMTAQPAADVVVSVESQDLTEGLVDVSEIIFTPNNWSVVQAVTVTPQDDNILDGDIFYNIKTEISTTDPLIVTNVFDVKVRNEDDEVAPGTPALVVNPSSGLVTYEAGFNPDGFLVSLGTQPLNPVNITVDVSDDTEAEVSEQNFVLDNSNWNIGHLVVVTGKDDNIVDGDVEYSITVTSSSADADYNGLQEVVSATNIDDDVTDSCGFVPNGDLIFKDGFDC